jgi:predicted phage replisome organizer
VAAVKWIKIVTDIFDDEKMLLVESLPSADSIIVVWFKLLCLAGKTNNSGVFIFNERIPYTDEMLASIFRRDVNIVRMALQTFENFGMIEIIDNVITIPNWSKHQTLDAYERQKERDRLKKQQARAEKKALISGKSGDASGDASGDVPTLEEDIDIDREEDIDNNTILPGAETPPDPPKPPKQKKPSSPVVISILLNDKTEYQITEADVAAWQELYQAVNIMQELRKMKGWADANPSKRKTRGGIKRFINGWLAKEQDKHHGPQGGGQNGAASQYSGNKYGTCI